MAKISKELQNFFNLKVTSANKAEVPILPAHKDEKGNLKPVKFPTSLQKAWDWWMDETHDSSQTLKGRQDRYSDLDYMIYNEPIIAMAVELYADEATQVDSQNNLFHIEAKDKKVEKEIRQLLDLWDLTQHTIREVAFNLALYGDHFNINSTSEKNGITDVTPVGVRDITDRIEFKMTEAQQKMKELKWFRAYMDNESRIKILYDRLSQVSNEQLSAMYRPYLFGFQIGEEEVLPPWNVSHFRLLSMNSEFYPFGRSLMIYSIGPFRQLNASKNMMALARAAKFPKEHFEVNIDENMDETEKWIAINQARQEYHNLGQYSQEKEEFAIGGEIWTGRDDISYNLIENNMSLEDIADIELLRDDLIMGTRVPKGYLVVDRSSFGTSGQALLQQFKPFGRAVYHLQSAILHEIVHMIRMHFLMTGQFEGPDTDFELSMNFPVVEESQDRLRMKNDTLRLANDVISNIQDALGTRDGLPPEVIKAVFGSLSFLDPEEVDKWIDQSFEALQDDEEESESGFGFESTLPSINRKLSESNKKKLLHKLDSKMIKQAYFDAARSNHMQEGVMGRRHFVNSHHITFQEQLLYEAWSQQDDGTLKG